MPPLLMSSVRFLIAGVALYIFASRGRARPTRARVARRRDRRRGPAARRQRRSRLGRDAARLRFRRADRGDHPALRRTVRPPVLRPAPVDSGRRRTGDRIRGRRAARASGRRQQRRRRLDPRRHDLRLGRRLAVCTRRAAAEQPAAVGLDADAGRRRLPRRRRARRRRGERHPSRLVRGQAADRVRVPRARRVADRLLRLRLAAEERAHLDRRHICLRQSGRRGRARNGVPGRVDRLVDRRCGSSDRACRSPDRDGKAALP